MIEKLLSGAYSRILCELLTRAERAIFFLHSARTPNAQRRAEHIRIPVPLTFSAYRPGKFLGAPPIFLLTVGR